MTVERFVEVHGNRSKQETVHIKINIMLSLANYEVDKEGIQLNWI